MVAEDFYWQLASRAAAGDLDSLGLGLPSKGFASAPRRARRQLIRKNAG
jgi:hypothetical protein